MQKYRPGNALPFDSVPLLLLASVVGGAIIGGIVGAISELIYLIVLFPILMGFAGGALLSAVVLRSKVRNPLIASLFGLLTAVIIYGSYQFSSYIFDRQKAVAQLQNDQSVSANGAQTLFDAALEYNVGNTGFIGYLQFTAQQGISFTSVGAVSDSSAVPLQGTLVYLYWGVEFLIIAGIAASAASRAAAKPFCDTCGTWYQGVGRLGSVDRKSSKPLVKLLWDGNLAQAKAMLTPSGNPPRTDLNVEFCRTCSTSDVVLSAKRVANTRRNRTNSTEIARGTITRQQFADLASVPGNTSAAPTQF